MSRNRRQLEVRNNDGDGDEDEEELFYYFTILLFSNGGLAFAFLCFSLLFFAFPVLFCYLSMHM